MGVLSVLGIDSLLSLRAMYVVVGMFVAFNILSWATDVIYNLYFHPLRHFPGPKLYLVLPTLRAIDSLLGRREAKTIALHEQYGDVVRVAPGVLTFTCPEAWKDIYGHGHAELPKAIGGDYRIGATPDIIHADAPTHFRYRRAMLLAFSDKALGEQEKLMGVYIDLLMARLREVAASGKPTDMVRWFNFTTFDLIGDLSFGEALGGLRYGTTNEWVHKIQQMIKVFPMLFMLRSFPLTAALLHVVSGDRLRKAHHDHRAMVKALVTKRIKDAELEHRGDFMDFFMRSRGKEHELTDDELAANADTLMIAGSETTSTLLSGVTYFLLSTPGTLEKCTEEVRSAFERTEDITFGAASMKLPYMLACLNEALRMYPPVPVAMLRETLPDQMTPIAGFLVPGKVRQAQCWGHAPKSDANSAT